VIGEFALSMWDVRSKEHRAGSRELKSRPPGIQALLAFRLIDNDLHQHSNTPMLQYSGVVYDVRLGWRARPGGRFYRSDGGFCRLGTRIFSLTEITGNTEQILHAL